VLLAGLCLCYHRGRSTQEATAVLIIHRVSWRSIKPPTASATTDAVVVVQGDMNIPRVFRIHLLVGRPPVFHLHARAILCAAKACLEQRLVQWLVVSRQQQLQQFGNADDDNLAGADELPEEPEPQQQQTEAVRSAGLCDRVSWRSIKPPTASATTDAVVVVQRDMNLLRVFRIHLLVGRPPVFHLHARAILCAAKACLEQRLVQWLVVSRQQQLQQFGNADDDNLAGADELPEEPEPQQQQTEPVRSARVVRPRRRRLPSRKCKQRRPTRRPTRVQPDRKCKAKTGAQLRPKRPHRPPTRIQPDRTCKNKPQAQL
jgi:hypothetical protein